MFWRTIFLAVLVCVGSEIRAGDLVQDNQRPIPNANTYKGRITKYSLNGLLVHTYESSETFKDWSIIFENDWNLVLLEPQSMPSSSKELHRYIDSLGKPLAGVLALYHTVGPDSFPGTPIYATPDVIDVIKSGKAEEVLKQAAQTVPGVDPKIIVPTHRLDAPEFSVGGIDFAIFPQNPGTYPGPRSVLHLPAYDLSLPRHKMYYMHRLGGDTHALLKNAQEIDPYIEYLRDLKKKGFEIFLSAHHIPETISGLDAKITYLETMKMVVSLSGSQEEFISEMRRLTPTKKGERLLHITAENLF